MGIGASIFLIAIGAILTWAIRDKPNATVDVDVVGIILMCVGLVGFFLSIWFWESWGFGRWWARGRYVQPVAADPAAAPRRYWGGGARRRVTYVEDAPPADPYGPPPPPPA